MARCQGMFARGQCRSRGLDVRRRIDLQELCDLCEARLRGRANSIIKRVEAKIRAQSKKAPKQ